MKLDWKKLGIAVALPLAVGGLSALITKDRMALFGALQKPPLSPPAWLFPAAWTLLYILMGLASYYVYTADAPKSRKRTALSYYALSLIFNFGWPILFFNMEKYLAAFVWLCIMWILILAAVVQFWASDKKAGALMLPYLLWVTFAGYLNYGIYLLN